MVSRYAVIERSTDLRDPRTRIWFVRNLRETARFREGSGRFTHVNPEEARNWYRTFVEVYELPSGWRKPPKRRLSEWVRREATPTYPRNELDALAWFIRREGQRLDLNGN